jgi:hypothetical protein
MILDKNLPLPLRGRTQLLPTFPYSRANLVIVGEKNIWLLTPATTILLPPHVTSRHPRDREGVQCNVNEGVQEHGWMWAARGKKMKTITSDVQRPRWFPTRGISSTVGKAVTSDVTTRRRYQYGAIVKFCMWYILRYCQYIHCSVGWLNDW